MVAQTASLRISIFRNETNALVSSAILFFIYKMKNYDKDFIF